MKKNFFAGPSYLHKDVWEGFLALIEKRDGLSVLEISHRSSIIRELFDEAEERIRALASVPDTHDILFLQGGSSLQFGMIPYNYLTQNRTAYFIETGVWSEKALKEAKKIGSANVVAKLKTG